MIPKKKTAVLLTILYTLIIGLLIGYFGGTLYYCALARTSFSAAILTPRAVFQSLVSNPLHRILILAFFIGGTLTLLAIMMLGGRKGYRS